MFGNREAFADIAARPRGWWLPLLLLMILAVSYIFAFTQRVGWERWMREAMAQSERFQEMPAEEREQLLQQDLPLLPLVAHVQGALAWPVATLVAAGAFVFVFSVLLGSPLTFRQVYALVCYGLLPQAVRVTLTLLVMFLKEPADFNIQNPLPSNLAAFLGPSTAPQGLINVGSSLDVFSLWAVLLLATAFSAASPKLAWWKAFAWVALTWGVWLVVNYFYPVAAYII